MTAAVVYTNTDAQRLQSEMKGPQIKIWGITTSKMGVEEKGSFTDTESIYLEKLEGNPEDITTYIKGWLFETVWLSFLDGEFGVYNLRGDMPSVVTWLQFPI